MNGRYSLSARIGEIKLVDDVVTHVSASRAGVEVLTEAWLTYDPISARNYAALIVRAADEVERMRNQPHDDLSIDQLAEKCCDEFYGEHGTFQNYKRDSDRERWRAVVMLLRGTAR